MTTEEQRIDSPVQILLQASDIFSVSSKVRLDDSGKRI